MLADAAEPVFYSPWDVASSILTWKSLPYMVLELNINLMVGVLYCLWSRVHGQTERSGPSILDSRM